MNNAVLEDSVSRDYKLEWVEKLDLYRKCFHPQDHRLLLVDDDSDQLAAFSFFLERAGFYVCGCSSALQALSRLRNDWFSLIISDLQMPEIDGADFIKRIRTSRSFINCSTFPVIVLTGSHSRREEDLLKLGADMFCTKDQAYKILV